jgi:hypothetical protein
VHVETRARISWLRLKNKVNGLSVVWPQNHWSGFFGLTSKQVVTVFSDLAIKLVATVSPNLASKSVAQVSGLDLKTGSYSLMFGPQN